MFCILPNYIFSIIFKCMSHSTIILIMIIILYLLLFIIDVISTIICSHKVNYSVILFAQTFNNILNNINV